MPVSVLNCDGYRGPLDEDFLRHSPAASPWMIFGENRKTGNVDISDITGDDVITGLPRDVAEELIALRDRFVDDVLVVLNRHLAKYAA